MLNLSVSVRQSPTQRASFRFENVESDLSVSELKKNILLKAGLDSQCQLELIYSCKTLEDETPLKSLEGIENGLKMIYAVVTKPVEKIQPKKLNAVDQHQLFLAFRAAMTNPNFRHTLQNFSKPESIQLLIETVPGLAEDEVALSMLQDWELLLHLADPKIVQTLTEKHPALVDATSRMMISITETLIPDVSQRRRSNSAGWLARSLGADMEDDGMDEDPPQQASANQSLSPAAFGGITPAQLAAALNFAQNNIRQPLPITPQQQQIPPQPSITPGIAQPQQQQSIPRARVDTNRTSSSNSNNGLTPEMFTQALLQAMNQMGGASRGSSDGTATASSSGATESRREDVRLREQFDRFLPQMRELGMNDDNLSLRALQATNGDIEAALNLIYAGLVDD